MAPTQCPPVLSGCLTLTGDWVTRLVWEVLSTLSSLGSQRAQLQMPCCSFLRPPHLLSGPFCEGTSQVTALHTCVSQHLALGLIHVGTQNIPAR